MTCRPIAVLIFFLLTLGLRPHQSWAQTRFKTLNYLYSIAGRQTVAGQHNREPNAQPSQWTDRIRDTTGTYPGLWSGDFLFQADNIRDRGLMVRQAETEWRRGAIVNLMWHACNPARSQPCGWDSSGVLSKLTDAQWTALLTEGTPVNTRWKQMMDEVAVYLQALKTAGVEVLFRPLHEMNQGAFWWGGRPGPTGTAALYRLTHDYFTKTKGLSNLIWVWDVQDFGTLASDVRTYNPGATYWDVVALDVYDGSGFTKAKYATMLAVAGGKPMGIGECQALPTSAQLTDQPRWAFFMGWAELVFSTNRPAAIRATYAAPTVVTLDEMPGW